jgi:threonine dehydratase
VVAGQGTVGQEIAEQAPDCDSVAVAVGGGGLIAGVSLAIGARTVVGVEPSGCASLHAAVAAGEPVDAPVDSVAASALGATRIGRIPYAVLGTARLDLALVEDAEILAARDRLWDEFRLSVEPAAAAVFAAWLANRVPGTHPCLILCGAN